MSRHALLLVAAALAIGAAASASVDGLTADADWIRRAKNGGGDELEVDGGGARRQLLLNDNTTDYISYGALFPDVVPCSVPGLSYYNCKPRAEANPYTRGCSAITQCRD